MASSFALTLDTYNPKLSLSVPPYIAADGILHVDIQADWPMDPFWQRIELTDAAGHKTQHIFAYDPETYTFHGLIQCTGVALGIATLQAQFRSDVWNPSEIVIGASLVRQASPVKIKDIVVHSRVVETTLTSRSVVPMPVERRPIELTEIKPRAVWLSSVKGREIQARVEKE